MGEFGALTALGPAGRNSRNEPLSRYRCDCGTEVVRVAATITGKRLHSCGCKLGSWAKGRSNLATRKHGMSRGAGVKGHPLYTVWIAMKQRCYYPAFRRFKDWGGRGIAVCAQWRDDFGAFSAWAFANGYEEGLQLDRIDNDGNYEPENCRFVTQSVNMQNTRRAAKYKEAANG